MKNTIILTNDGWTKTDNAFKEHKIALDVDLITAVVQSEKFTTIVYSESIDIPESGQKHIYVQESFDDVMKKIEEANKKKKNSI